MTVTKPSVDSYSLREVANCGTNLPEFLIEPYLQLSKHYQVSKTGSLALRWFSAQRGKWKVLYRQEKDQLFKEAKVVRKQADLLAGQQHSRYQAQLSGLTCGKPLS